MSVSRWTLLAGMVGAAACATAAATARPPLAAHLLPTAQTGAPVPLRFDPNAKVIPSSAANLPAATFLPSQAARGARLYEESCGVCHQQGQLVGQGFVESWNNRRVYDLYALIAGTMPLNKPGGLKDQEYLEIVAYLLQANHAQAGRDSLRADSAAMRKTRIAVSFP